MTRQSRKVKKARKAKAARKAREAKAAESISSASDTSSLSLFATLASFCSPFLDLVLCLFRTVLAIHIFTSAPAPPTVRKPTQFLDLPPEIRLDVYDLYLASIPYDTTGTQRFSTPTSFRPPLLRVCHQVRREVIKPYLKRLQNALLSLEYEHYAFMAHSTALLGLPATYDVRCAYLQNIFENEKLTVLLQEEVRRVADMRDGGSLGTVRDAVMDQDRVRELAEELRPLVGQDSIETGEHIIAFARKHRLNGLQMAEINLGLAEIFTDEYQAGR